LLLEAGAGYWPDDAKKVALDRILSDDLAKSMITVPTQPDFNSYYAILKSTDDKLKAYKSRASKSKDSTIRTSPPTWKRPTDDKRAFAVNNTPSEQKVVRKASVESMEWEPTPAKVATSSTKRAKWASQEERENRRRTGRCIRCGASGHVIRECPYGSPQRPVTTDSARKGKGLAKEVAPELEDDEISSESEN